MSRPPVLMWAHSRSASTAFLRMMIERGDVAVLHEPFLALTEEGSVTLPSADGGEVTARSEKELLALLAELARVRPVFVKEVLDYEYPHLFAHPEDLAGFTHTFMVRDPEPTISSHYAIKPAVTCEEIGYERLFRLFELAWRATGRRPLVLRTERLVREPARVVETFCAYAGLPFLPESLTWDAGERPEWRRTRRWHLDASGSAGFEDRRNAYPATVANHPLLRAFYDHHLPFYQRLVQYDQGAPMSESPGRLFARAYADDPAHAEVTFDYTITEAHEPTKDRPRLTVRNLLKVVPVEGDAARFWTESPPGEEERRAVRDSGVRREAAFTFGMSEAKVEPIRAWVQIPDGLAADLDALATFLDYRLLVRLATAENLALTTALLGHPEIARLPCDDYVHGILSACDEVEQSGATPHAMIVNPRDYYHRLVGRGGLLAELAEGNGMKVSRNRWVAPGDALVGDISVAARLLDARRSVIRVAEPPPGTFARPGVAVCAEVYEGVAVHLPGLFYLVTLAKQNGAFSPV